MTEFVETPTGANQRTLYARWTSSATPVTVTFSGNENTGGTAPTPMTDAPGSTVTLPSQGSLVKTGYAFGGWNTQAAGNGTTYAAGATYTLPSSSVTLYAKWNFSGSTVTLTVLANPSNGGTVSGGGTYTIGSSHQISATPNPGWTFDGWSHVDTLPNLIGNNPFTVQIPAGGATYTAIFSQSVLMISPTSRNHLSAAASGQTIAVTGEFNWSVSENADWVAITSYGSDGITYSVRANTGTLRSTNITFSGGGIIRVFTVTQDGSVANKFSLSYNANGATSGTAPSPMTNASGSTVTLPSQGSLLKTGYAFGGWNTQVDGNGTTYAKGASYTLQSSSVTLYAKWTAITYTATFNAQGGSVSPASKGVAVGVVYGTLPTPTRVGYVFVGWWTGTGGTGVQVSSSSTVTQASNHTLYAKWIAIPKLTVAGGGIDGDVNPAFVLSGEERLVSANEPAVGKVFDKWTVSPTTATLGAGFNARDGSTTVVMPSVSVTLTAVYIAIPKLTVTGGLVDGEGVNSAFVLPGEERLVSANEPAVGKVFDKWTVSPTTATLGAGFNARDGFTTVAMPSVSVTLTAVYIAIPKLTVNGGGIGGEAGNSAFVFPGEERQVSAGEPVAGKVFEKWMVVPATANLGGMFNPRSAETTVAMPSVNVTLTAVYVTAPGFVSVNVDGNIPNDGLELSGIFWSVDNAAWVPVNDGNGYPLKPGMYTVSFKSANLRWLAPVMQTVKVISEQSLDVSAEAIYVPVVSWGLSGESAVGSGTVTLSPTNGQVLPGKGVTLTAKPSADYVFAGWENLEGMSAGSERKPALTVSPASDTVYTARFRAKSDCESPEIMIVDPTECMVGVAYSSVIGVNDGAMPVIFTSTALPAGLKLDPVTGLISGVPTKAGSFSGTVNASNVKGAATPQACTFTVAPLPVWAQGTFNGVADSDVFGTGVASMSVTALGAASGKLSLAGTNYSFSAGSFMRDVDVEGVLVLACTAAVGKVSIPLSLHTSLTSFEGALEGVTPGALGVALNMSASGDFGGTEGVPAVSLYRNVWKDTDMVAVATNYTGYYTATLPGGPDYGSGYLAFTVDKLGNVKTAGKLADGTAVSLSGALIVDTMGRVFTVLYTAPAVYKGGVFFGAAEFRRSDTGAMVVSPNQDLPFIWCSFNPLATGEYGMGMTRELSIAGGYYDKLINLRSYYEYGLAVGYVDILPPLLATVRFTDIDPDSLSETPPKITWTESTEASSADVSPSGLVLGVTPATGDGTGLSAPATKQPLRVIDPDTGDVWYDYEVSENQSGLTIAFTRATGLFTGGFSVYYDYVSAMDYTTGKQTWTHIEKRALYEGVLTPVRAEGEAEGRGFFLWADKGSYDSGRVDANGDPIMTAFPFSRSYDFQLLMP